LSRLYGLVFVTYILRLFSEGTVTGPADIISMFIFGSHVVKQVEGNCSHRGSYPPIKFWQSQWRHVRNILDLPPKDKNGESSQPNGLVKC
jgi:hypothetical protein